MDQRMITSAQLNFFRAYLYEEERSRATVEKYLRETGQFAAWVSGAEVTKTAAAQWKEHLLAQGYHPSTVNGKLTAVERFFDFMGWEDCKVKHLKLQRRLFRDDSRELTRQEYERLVELPEAHGQERLCLLMESICATGIRVSEVKYLHRRGSGPGEGGNLPQGENPHHPHPGEAVQKAVEVRPEAKNYLWRNLSHQRRQGAVQKADLGGNEGDLRKSGSRAE